ncbi:hypothetical protein GNI_124350 [Gregarina niphandrodes]|uniref:Uncharacterized protein n=1 Tax=Gregarina niphandrodes TaxID=110365 RepID=A0A023B258_GRENI|nr:hypothetical protein GNI_124350 [Gregarina niphandrodes]EZG51526.1 hypothetical protein GNI_124350 [Gregarina niphandrodes]|eukprot:XP_011131964.1 hypothetical protein GNI_124350 [Gregarina niphandrodes]
MRPKRRREAVEKTDGDVIQYIEERLRSLSDGETARGLGLVVSYDGVLCSTTKGETGAESESDTYPADYPYEVKFDGQQLLYNTRWTNWAPYYDTWEPRENFETATFNDLLSYLALKFFALWLGQRRREGSDRVEIGSDKGTALDSQFVYEMRNLIKFFPTSQKTVQMFLWYDSKKFVNWELGAKVPPSEGAGRSYSEALKSLMFHLTEVIPGNTLWYWQGDHDPSFSHYRLPKSRAVDLNSVPGEVLVDLHSSETLLQVSYPLKFRADASEEVEAVQKLRTACAVRSSEQKNTHGINTLEEDTRVTDMGEKTTGGYKERDITVQQQRRPSSPAAKGCRTACSDLSGITSVTLAEGCPPAGDSADPWGEARISCHLSGGRMTVLDDETVQQDLIWRPPWADLSAAIRRHGQSLLPAYSSLRSYVPLHIENMLSIEEPATSEAAGHAQSKLWKTRASEVNVWKVNVVAAATDSKENRSADPVCSDSNSKHVHPITKQVCLLSFRRYYGHSGPQSVWVDAGVVAGQFPFLLANYFCDQVISEYIRTCTVEFELFLPGLLWEARWALADPEQLRSVTVQWADKRQRGGPSKSRRKAEAEWQMKTQMTTQTTTQTKEEEQGRRGHYTVATEAETTGADYASASATHSYRGPQEDLVVIDSSEDELDKSRAGDKNRAGRRSRAGADPGSPQGQLRSRLAASEWVLVALRGRFQDVFSALYQLAVTFEKLRIEVDGAELRQALNVPQPEPVSGHDTRIVLMLPLPRSPPTGQKAPPSGHDAAVDPAPAAAKPPTFDWSPFLNSPGTADNSGAKDKTEARTKTENRTETDQGRLTECLGPRPGEVAWLIRLMRGVCGEGAVEYPPFKLSPASDAHLHKTAALVGPYTGVREEPFVAPLLFFDRPVKAMLCVQAALAALVKRHVTTHVCGARDYLLYRTFFCSPGLRAPGSGKRGPGDDSALYRQVLAMPRPQFFDDPRTFHQICQLENSLWAQLLATSPDAPALPPLNLTRVISPPTTRAMTAPSVTSPATATVAAELGLRDRYAHLLAYGLLSYGCPAPVCPNETTFVPAAFQVDEWGDLVLQNHTGARAYYLGPSFSRNDVQGHFAPVVDD